MLLQEVELAEKYWKVRKTTEQICKPLHAEDYVVQPIVDVSPPKWHLGHTTWFFETFILKQFADNYKVFNDGYGFVFNSYYESVGKRVIRTDRGNLTRPTVDEVMAYRSYVDEAMDDFLKGDCPSAVDELMMLGLQHEQQHQELLMYDIKYILGNNPLFPVYIDGKVEETKKSKPLSFLSVDEGVYDIGHNTDGFCFDNELGAHKVYLHGYEIADRLVTNEEYLEFMEDGGYTNFKHWLSEGWAWVNEHKIVSPFHWHKIDDEWCQYSLRGGLKPLDLHAPVAHVSFFEADAFAKWKGMRLPTEFEWETAAKIFEEPRSQGNSNFLETDCLEPMAAGDNNQFLGDVWEWTNSAYLPYPYYETAEGAVGEYNGKFMVNQMVLRGGSCVSPGNHIRNTYRNFFHPNLRWLFSGFRLAKNI